MIDFTKMGSEDGRLIELNRSGPMKDIICVTTCAESFNALAYYYYYYHYNHHFH
jgi:hypothetical protein